MGQALEYLLAPYSVETFITEIWEKKPLFIQRGQPDYFQLLFSLDAADELLAQSDVWYPSLRLFYQGKQIDPEYFTGRWAYGRHRFNTIIDRDKIFALYRKGATINILGLERSWPAIMEINKNLEEESGFPVHTTAFLTPKNAENIPPHYDMVDFFTVQVGGAKRWRLWESDQQLPLVGMKDRIYQRGDEAVGEDRLIGDYLLCPGDTLYVPRGMIHEAVTTDTYSLHVTIGLNVHRWYDVIEVLVKEGLKHLTNNPLYRQALPTSNGLAANSQSKNTELLFQSLVEDLRAYMYANLALGYQAIDNALLKDRYPSRPGQLIDIRNLDALGLDDRIVRRAGIAYSLTQEDKRLFLRFHNKTLSFSPDLLVPLQFLTRASPFAVHELPDVFDAPSKLAFTRRLIAEGFLTWTSSVRAKLAPASTHSQP